MKVETLFAITHNSDLTEGRGHTVILGYTRTQELADAIVSDKRFVRWCGMGYHDAAECKKHNVRKQDVVIFEDVEELYTRQLDVERQKALAKLSDHDKKNPWVDLIPSAIGARLLQLKVYQVYYVDMNAYPENPSWD